MTTSQPVVLAGQCACGQTTWQSTSLASHLDFCYCTLCARVTGAPFGAWTGIPKDSITWKGPIGTYTVSELATRSMCKTCGASLSIQYHCYPDKTHVAAGTVVKGAEKLPKVGVHIFVKEVPSWYSIPSDDGLPRWDGFDDEFTERQRKYEAERNSESRK